MRKLYVSLSAAAIIATGAVAALPSGAMAGTAMLPAAGGGGVIRTASTASTEKVPSISFSTTMLSYTAVNVVPGGLAPGDGYVLAGRVTRHGAADGLSTASCTYTITKGPVLRICTVDYALNNGLIATTGYIDGAAKGATVTLVVDGGTGAYANARGFGHLQPTSTGSNVALNLTS